MTFVVPDRDDWCLPTLLRRYGDARGDQPFLSFALDERTLSYAEAANGASAVAAGLARLGVAQGDRVLLMLRNRAEFALSILGAASLGAVQTPVNLDYSGELLEHVANSAAAAVLVVEEDLVDVVARSLPHLPHLRTIVVLGNAARLGGRVTAIPFEELTTAPPQRDHQHVRPSDPAAIHFTSGTSGPSKGALVPHAAAHLLAERNRELLALEHDAVYFTELPLFHVHAQMSLYSTLLAGAQIRIERRFSASCWLDRVRSSGATHTSMLGVMLGFVLAQPASSADADNSLRVVWTVPCPTDAAAAFRERFGIERIVTSYGSTEIGMVARRVVGEGPPGSAGRVDPDFYEVRVVDEWDEPVPASEVGELVVRPRLPWTTMLGYIGVSDAAFTVLRNLWFHTGDLVRLDEAGNLWFVDRLGDRIRRRGENIASADVERVLEAHPEIAEAAAVAVPAPEQGGEDEIKAVVVPAVGAALDTEMIWAWCDLHLPHFAVPRYLEIAGELPKTPTAKVQKGELRATGIGESTADRGPAASRAGRR